MAISFASVGDGLTRSGTYLQPAIDWTVSMWVRFDSVPAGSDYQSLWLLGPADYSPPWIQIFSYFDGGVSAPVVFAACDPGSGQVSTAISQELFTDTDYYITLQYSAGDQELSFQINASEIGTVGVDLTGLSPITTEFLATDTDTAIAGLVMSYVGVWQSALVTSDIQEQMGGQTPTTTANLKAFTPLPTHTDLTDISGHGRNWTGLGSLATATGPLHGNVALSGTTKFLTSDSVYARAQTISGPITGETFIAGAAGAGSAGIRVSADQSEYYALTTIDGSLAGQITVYDANGDAIRTIEDPVDRGYTYITLRSSGTLLVGVNGQNIVLEVTPDGDFINTYTGFTGDFVRSMSVNGDILVYVAAYDSVPAGNHLVGRFNLDTQVHLDPLIDFDSDTSFWGLIALDDGGAVVGQAAPDVSPKLQRVDDMGAQIWTQDFTSPEEIWGISLDPDGAIVWAFSHSAALPDGITTPAILYAIALADGSISDTLTLSQAFTAFDLDFIEPVVVVYDVTGSCADNTLTATGAGLDSTDTIEVFGPGGDSLTFTVVSATYSELILHVDDAFQVGGYCVQVNDLEPVCVDLSCVGETFPICRMRQFPLIFLQNFNITVDRLEFLIQSGMSPDATITVELSRDGGQTWPITRTLTAGALGNFSFRVFGDRFGKGRNWVCRFITSEPYFWSLIQCYEDYREHTS